MQGVLSNTYCCSHSVTSRHGKSYHFFEIARLFLALKSEILEGIERDLFIKDILQAQKFSQTHINTHTRTERERGIEKWRQNTKQLPLLLRFLKSLLRSVLKRTAYELNFRFLLFVCSFVNSSETVEPNELKF